MRKCWHGRCSLGLRRGKVRGIEDRQSATIKIKGERKHVVDNPGDSFGVVVGGTRGKCWRGLDSPFTGGRGLRLDH